MCKIEWDISGDAWIDGELYTKMTAKKDEMMILKKYILFGYDQYYPNGGLTDIIDSYDSLAEATSIAKNESCDWWYIIDRDTWKVMLEKTEQSNGENYNLEDIS